MLHSHLIGLVDFPGMPPGVTFSCLEQRMSRITFLIKLTTKRVLCSLRGNGVAVKPHNTKRYYESL